jgi:hypothetical protein
MTPTSLRLALAAGLALSLGIATAGFAQDAPAAPPGGMAVAPHRDPVAIQAHRAERLRALLQLQPGQDAALNAFLDAMKPPAGWTPGQRSGGDEMARLSTPERLDRLVARLDERRARLVQRAAAAKQFYAQLTPSQQKAFDDLAPMMLHRLGGPPGPDGRWGWRRDGGGPPMGAGGPPQG